MADREVDFLLIGGGMASAHCAAELRKRGAEGSILLVGREPEPPYERPPLSKEYLRGEAERARTPTSTRPSWYEENGVELLTGAQRDVARPRGADGEAPGRGGGRLRQGADRHRGDGQHPPRRGRRERGHPLPARFGNSDAIRADAEAAEHVVLIGGSYIGCEVAASLTAKGVEVHDRDDGGRGALADLRRGRRALVPGAARIARRRPSTAARSSRPSRATAGSGRCVTESGLAIECDTVVVGAGVRRRRDAGRSGPGSRSSDGGSSATRSCRPRLAGIYAAGDCCSYDSVVHGRRIRVEHWDVAMQQGMHAAGNMLGADARLRRRPLLLQRPRRLGEPRVRRPGLRLGRGGLARRPRRRRVLGLVPEGRPGRRLPQRRALRRPRRGAPDARRRRRRLGRGERSPTPTATSPRSS